MMKKMIYVMSFITILASQSCKEDKFRGTDHQLVLSGMQFTQALNNAEKLALIKEGSLCLESGAKSNFFNASDGISKDCNAPILLTQVDNRKPFTFIAKVTPQFTKTYDAGALFIYVDDNLWQKFAFEMDERGLTRVVTVRTMETSDDNNHDAIADKSVFMKISSDTQTIGFYYSIDKEKWQLARLYRNEYPPIIWVGVSSQSPMGKGIVTQFDECMLTEGTIKSFRMGI